MSERITDQAPLLSIRDLKVAFRTQEGLREVLHGISFDVFPGETVAIVGSRVPASPRPPPRSSTCCPAPARSPADRSPSRVASSPL